MTIIEIRGYALTEKQIINAKKVTNFRWKPPYHQHNDCIRIACEWLQAQIKLKNKTPQRQREVPIVQLIEDWGRRSVSIDDILVAAKILKLKGGYHSLNISLKRTFPSKKRLLRINQAGLHSDYIPYSDAYTYFEDSADADKLRRKYRKRSDFVLRERGQIFYDEIIVPPDRFWFSPAAPQYYYYQILPRRIEQPQMMSTKQLLLLHPSEKDSVKTPHALPEQSGCYAAIENGKVLYVGRAENLKRRCCNHDKIYSNGSGTWRLFFWVTKDFISLEENLIHYLRPSRNILLTDNCLPKLCSWNGKYRECLEKSFKS